MVFDVHPNRHTYSNESVNNPEILTGVKHLQLRAWRDKLKTYVPRTPNVIVQQMIQLDTHVQHTTVYSKPQKMYIALAQG